MNIQTYNSAITFRQQTIFRLLCLVCLTCPAWAQSFTAQEAEMAEKIVGRTGPGALNVKVTNRSTLSSQVADEIRRGLLTELASRGAHFVSIDQAAAAVEVFLSENEQSYLWIARIEQGANAPVIEMVSLHRAAGPLLGLKTAQLRLTKTLLWSQAKPILDAGTISAEAPHLVVLSADAITLYRLQNEHPQLEQTITISHQQPWPQDLRGRLLVGKEHLLQAYLPGVVCQSSAGIPLSLNCRDSDDPWPVGIDQFQLNAFFATRRNFFTGVVSPAIGKQNPAPFYSAAPVPREKYTLWLIAGVDGRVHFVDGITDQIAGNLGWGSDIAPLRSACGSGWQILATSMNENEDSVRAFEIVDRSPVPVSEPLSFAGSITAFWPDMGGARAVAVDHNLATGFYEAYSVSIACDSR